MDLMILHQPKFHGAVPSDILTIQDFGRENVIDDAGTEHVGNSIIIRGTAESITKWLGGKEVWTTSNPLVGWGKRTIKKAA